LNEGLSARKTRRRRTDAAEQKWALPTVAKGLGDGVPIKMKWSEAE